ncbi:tripartite tricarboxylate transporter substrate binding protein [Brenneria tiliae]|uniref:tripartite tricarboxylate transporter substrate binding protein n=1 Tax=Brenneria tiliae TaxID=2914984 RepID=UPI002014BCEB|nr:tripartite tricarboxylate transporter substrate binding protein [Brenneria tiliae]MCL2896938.1 tripartite tricarboxylate transporter substrate binding protein [Brenneria tiliae]MCL2901496.1 tripartite tricarboxylate transporter substrate binding protein [Brenneria tiliae]
MKAIPLYGAVLYLPITMLLFFSTLARGAENDDWRPTHSVQVLVGVGPGGSMDRTARMVNDGLKSAGLAPAGSEVVNRPGGGHALALNALLNQPGRGESIQVVNTPFITNKLLGRSPIDYKKFTPLALLFSERFLFAVRSDSPIKDGKDLIARLRQDPSSVSFSVSSGVGTVNFAAAMELAAAAGADIHKIKAVSFNSAAEGVTATLGGHIDVVITTPSSIVPFVQAQRLRVLASATEARLGGVLADVPTWREQGADVVVSGWRIVIGPPGLTPAQVRFWDAALRQITSAPAWHAQLQQEYIDAGYGDHRVATRLLDDEAQRLTALYSTLGLAAQ